jgi:hypothetical protein
VKSRVPDAVQRFFSDAPQSRNHNLRTERGWTPDQQRHRKSAAQHPGHVSANDRHGKQSLKKISHLRLIKLSQV